MNVSVIWIYCIISAAAFASFGLIELAVCGIFKVLERFVKTEYTAAPLTKGYILLRVFYAVMLIPFTIYTMSCGVIIQILDPYSYIVMMPLLFLLAMTVSSILRNAGILRVRPFVVGMFILGAVQTAVTLVMIFTGNALW